MSPSMNEDFLTGVKHGVDTSNVYFQVWLVAVPLSYFFLLGLFRHLSWWDFPTRRGNRTSDIMAFLAVAGACVTYLAGAGVYAYATGEDAAILAQKDGQFYGRSVFVENHLVYPMLSYQGWNLLLCFVTSDLRDAAMIGHHFVTGSLGYLGLYPYLHYRGLFFFGLAELTNIPLTVVDVFKYFKNYPGIEKFENLNQFSRTLFGISFVILRLVYWPIYSYPFWTDSYQLLISGKAHSNFVVGFFLFANVFLTGLQFMWGNQIISSILFKEKKTVSSDKGSGNSSSSSSSSAKQLHDDNKNSTEKKSI